MKSSSAPEFSGRGLNEPIRSINAPEFTGRGPDEPMKSINALKFTGRGLNEQMKSISAPCYGEDHQKSANGEWLGNGTVL
ncbi:hypothetical protein HQN87_08545 [Paenibacillus tritici]|uniref:Uncharacterized protein n=1 Tax=Paenibacillus tritici TaxID=1873425 RepID=A0ABX2DMW0_9BACL|nr:hypothetical protein [Paenibacillus tritici]NQX45378.1 hypothetical protein [Paenibacillus tritici]